MKRVATTDGHWFDVDKAEKFDEATRWDGHNHISIATGSQWNHERLFRTAGAKWILNAWSQYQGTPETYEEIGNDEAAKWLVVNGHEAHEACSAEYADLEIK